MNKPLPLIDAEGEVRELGKADFGLFRPSNEALPLELQKVLGMKPRGRPAGSATTEQVAIRINAQALAKWRASGKGWQTRAAKLLAEHAPGQAVT